MAIEYSVVISGPGGCVNNVAVVVERALRDAGFGLTVRNPAPPDRTDAEMVQHVARTTRDGSQTVVVAVEHVPWGG